MGAQTDLTKRPTPRSSDLRKNQALEQISGIRVDMESISRISLMLDTGLYCVHDDSSRADSDLSTGINIGGCTVCWFCKNCQFSPFEQGFAIRSDKEIAR